MKPLSQKQFKLLMKNISEGHSAYREAASILMRGYLLKVHCLTALQYEELKRII